MKLELGISSPFIWLRVVHPNIQNCVTLGRGHNYSTAFEWALKLKELTYIVAELFSSTDFQHRPLALVTHGFPVLAVAPNGGGLDSMAATLTRIKKKT